MQYNIISTPQPFQSNKFLYCDKPHFKINTGVSLFPRFLAGLQMDEPITKDFLDVAAVRDLKTPSKVSSSMMSVKYINMADNAAKVTNARSLAITQLSVGFLLLCFGIGEQVLEELVKRDIYFGIWAGIWVGKELSNVTSCTQGLVYR